MRTDTRPASLFILAHPDDEFFCLPFLDELRQKGWRIICAYLTDGAYGGQPTAPRVQESQTVLSRYGVSHGDIHFIGLDAAIPDGGLHRHIEAAYIPLEAIYTANSPMEVYVPAWEGGHQDHDACHAIGVTLTHANHALTLPKQFALYNGHRLSGPLFHVMSTLSQNGPVDETRVSLRSAFRYLGTAFAYPSQWKTWFGLFPFAAFKILYSRRYRLQGTCLRRMGERPHDGLLLYERRGGARYEDVAATIAALTKRCKSSG